MITIKIPPKNLQIGFYGDSVTVSIGGLDTAQFRKMAEILAEKDGAEVTLKGVTIREGF